MPSDLRHPPYKLYRTRPRGLRELLRGEEPVAFGGQEPPRGGGPWWRPGRHRRPGGPRRPITPGRVLKWIVLALVAWVVLSLVLFIISAQTHSGDLPAGTESALSSGAPMLFSANTVLVLGLDNRPTSGAGSREPGANHTEAAARTDTIMLWRIGGGVSRRLSIPRDTLVEIPGHGQSKINAAWTYGGPALAIRTVEQFTGVKINHLIVVDLGRFPKFIDDIGGIDIKTGRICSNISGGVKNGGFTLDLQPGVHHLDGLQALILARTRENSCNPASNDLTREAMQQQILNSIKAQLLTFHTFLHLPWASWDAPGVLQTDMGAASLMQFFISSEIGGSAPVKLLSETGGTYAGQDVLIPSQANVRSAVDQLLNG